MTIECKEVLNWIDLADSIEDGADGEAESTAGGDSFETADHIYSVWRKISQVMSIKRVAPTKVSMTCLRLGPISMVGS